MSKRTATPVRSVLTFLLALSLFALPAYAVKDRKTGLTPAEGGGEIVGPNEVGKRVPTYAVQKDDGDKAGKAPLFDREVPFWSFSRGPMYGTVPTDMLSSSNVLQLGVGSFDTRGAGFALPDELIIGDRGFAAGPQRYFLIQLTEKSVLPDILPLTLKSIEKAGVKLVEYVPNNGYIVRVDASSLAQLGASSSIQYLKPYHPAYKLQPTIGSYKLLDRARAATDDYTVIVSVFEGERQNVEAAIQALGGSLLPDSDKSESIWANMKGSKVLELAKVEGVRDIGEYGDHIAYDEENQMMTLNGFYTVGAKPSFYKQGVNGSGGYLFDCDCNSDGTVNSTGCPVAKCGSATSDIDYNGNAKIDSSAQVVHDNDSGLSVDAADFSEKNNDTATISSSGTELTFKVGHRKMAGYIISPGAGASGDLKTCDAGGSGGFTHGQSTASVLAGNASQVPNNLPSGDPVADWDGNGTLDNYGAGFFFTSGTNSLRVDGTAKGARIFFEDNSKVCPETGGVAPGALETDLQTAHDRGARIHNFSFGVDTTLPVYDADAQAIDSFLIKNRTSMVFVSAGNAGADNGDQDPFGQLNTLGNDAQNKNAVTVGACLEDPFRLARAFFSANGGAGTGGTRIKPDLMAPGQDLGGAGLVSDYFCKSDDDENVTTTDIRCVQPSAVQGTSYSSPSAAGAGAIARDYFVVGMYPDGTKDNASNASDRVNNISGALVKAILIAATDNMPGDNLGTNNLRWKHRLNNYQGYGSLDLSNALPLTDDPNTPFGLIVHDAGVAGLSSKVQSLSLPTAGLTNGQRACDTFKVVDNGQPLNVVLAWVDDNTADGTASPTSGVENDLALEVIDPGADGTASSGNGDDVLYYGNIFTEDFNDDGTFDANCDLQQDGTANDTCDFDHDGTVDSGGNSLGVCRACGDVNGDGTSNNTGTMPNSGLCDNNGDNALTGGECKAKPVDTANVVEAVFLSPDPNGDGTGAGHNADNQIRVGNWKVCVNRVNAANTNTQHYALVITGGVSIQSSVRLDTNPLKCNGDIGVSITEKDDGTDPCCTSSGSCNVDTCVEPRTRVEVRNAAFLNDTLDNDGDGTIDEGKNGCGGSPPCDVDADGDGTKDSGEDLVDLERAGTGFQLTQSGLGFDTAFRMPASAAAALAYHFNDCILAVQDGYSVVGFYRDVTATTTVAERRSNASTDCTASFDLFNLRHLGRDLPFLISGGCDDDNFLDRGEALSYQVQMGNLDTTKLRNARVTLRGRKPAELDGFDNDSDGTIDENDGSEQLADPCRTKCNLASCDMTQPGNPSGVFTISPDHVDVGDWDNNIADTFLGTKTIAFNLDVRSTAPVATFPQQVEMVVGLTSPASGDTAASCKVFRHLLEADDDALAFSTDYPSGTGGATVDVDLNEDERIGPGTDTNGDGTIDGRDPLKDPTYPFALATDVFAGIRNTDKLTETVTYQNLQTTAFGGGNPGLTEPWDFDVSDNGFRSGLYKTAINEGVEMTLWGEDHNFNNILDGPKRCDDRKNPTTCNINSDCAGGHICRVQEDVDGNQDGVLNENYSTLGGCGFASRNGTAKGIWHSGTIKATTNATCIGTDDTTAIRCEYFDVLPSSSGTGDRWREILTTPVLTKVHRVQDGALCDGKDNDGDGACVGGSTPFAKCQTNADCTPGTCNPVDEDDTNDGTAACTEGFAYRLELTDWRWNLNADYKFQAGEVLILWEWDMDTTQPDPVTFEDRDILQLWGDGGGPINGQNVELVNGFPMFTNNDPTPGTGVANQRNGVSDNNNDGTIDGDVGRDGTISDSDTLGNRLTDRGCMFEGIARNHTGTAFRLRDPQPLDDDCDADPNPGPDGKPGAAGVDDDGNGIIDDKGELCPCYKNPDGQDDDGDGAVDEPDELQRFWTCSNSATKCRINADCGAGTCRQYGKPTPFGDDICGDGTIDENVTGRFARGTIQDELTHRVESLGNFYIGTVNGPFLRFDTLEDIYGVEAGETFQGAVSVSNRDLDTTANSTTNYGFAVDDMVAEWTETHPIAQSPLNKCAISTPTFGAGDGVSGTSGGATGTGIGGVSRTGGGDTATGGPQAPETDVAANSQAQCAGMAVASDVLFEASTSVSIQVVDTNAATTQGTFNCCKYSPAPAGCISGPVYLNDCDSNGLKEVEVTVFNQEEPAGQSVGAAGQGGGGFSASAGTDTRDQGENFKLEQVAPSGLGSDTYRGTVAVSSVLNQKGDGRIFVQWRASAFPQFVVRYVDKNDGVTGTSLGADGKPGLPNVDDDFDSLGPDRKPGAADFDDDGTGACDRQSGNYGALCHVDSPDCTESGHCLLKDDAREGCRDRNNDGTINQTDAFGDDQCLPIDTDADGTTDVGVDETDELCPRGIKTLFSDDTCGCALNPIQQTIISDFDNADIIVSAFKVFDNINGGDNDGIPDDQEKDKMRVTVRNLSTGRLENVKLRLNSRDKDIACITDNLITTKNGSPITLNQSAFFQTDDPNGDTFEFIVGNPGNDRNHDGTVNDIFRDVSATFQVTATGDIIDTAGNRKPFYGTVSPATFSMELDLDASVSNASTLKATDKKVIIFNQIGSAQCSATKECYNRTANDANNFYKKWTASAFPNRSGLHCQLNDPTNPNVHAVSPVGCFIGQTLNGTIFVDNDRDGTSDPGNSDWHFHGIWSRSNNILGNETRGHSSTGADTNEGALHMGFHDQNGSGTCRDPDGVTLRTCENSGGNGASQSYGPAQDVDFDTTHFDNLFEIHYNVPFRIGLGRGDFDGTAGVDEERPTLSFWHQVSLSRAFGDSVTWDGGVVMALVDRTDDGTINVGSPLLNTKDGQWKKLFAYYGVPNQQPISFINCKWDPDDDGSTEKDLFPADTLFGPSTLCFPEIVWGCVGDTQDAPYDPGGNQFQAADSCYPETRLEFNAAGVDENGDGTANGGDSGIAGCTNRNCNGTGNWVETKFDLSAFKGRSIFIRFLTGSAALVGSRTWMDFLQLGGNLDDGWYIDDLVLTGLQCGGNQTGNVACGAGNANQFKMRADPDSPPSNTCSTNKCPSNPTAALSLGTYSLRTNGVDDDHDGTIDEADETDPTGEAWCSDAPGRLVELDATASSVATCLGGQLEYQFTDLGDGDGDGTTNQVIQGFSASSTTTANPFNDTAYRVDVRCSSATTCTASASADIQFAKAGHDCVPTMLPIKGSTTFCWMGPAGPGATYSIVRGDLNRLVGDCNHDAVTGDAPTAFCAAGNFSLAIDDPGGADPIDPLPAGGFTRCMSETAACGVTGIGTFGAAACAAAAGNVAFANGGPVMHGWKVCQPPEVAGCDLLGDIANPPANTGWFFVMRHKGPVGGGCPAGGDGMAKGMYNDNDPATPDQKCGPTGGASCPMFPLPIGALGADTGNRNHGNAGPANGILEVTPAGDCYP